jgi:hypothetical protein
MFTPTHASCVLVAVHAALATGTSPTAMISDATWPLLRSGKVISAVTVLVSAARLGGTAVLGLSQS